MRARHESSSDTTATTANCRTHVYAKNYVIIYYMCTNDDDARGMADYSIELVQHEIHAHIVVERVKWQAVLLHRLQCTCLHISRQQFAVDQDNALRRINFTLTLYIEHVPRNDEPFIFMIICDNKLSTSFMIHNGVFFYYVA